MRAIVIVFAGLICHAAAEMPVFGCYKNFKIDRTIDLGMHNSNSRCQRTCGSQGLPIAATSDCTKCHCGFVYPSEQQTNATDCEFGCGNRCVGLPGFDLQSCCGGKSSYVISGVGPVNVHRDVVRSVIAGWHSNRGLRKFIVDNAKKFKWQAGDYENPDVSVTMNLPESTIINECHAKAKDKSYEVGTLRCAGAEKANAVLNAMEMELVEAVPGAIKRPELMGQYVCENRASVPMDCSRQYKLVKETHYSITATTSVSVMVRLHASFKITMQLKFPFLKIQTFYQLQATVEKQATFTGSATQSQVHTEEQVYGTTAIAQPGKRVIIQMWRDQQDYTYAWQTRFRALGSVELKFHNGYVYRNSASIFYNGDHSHAFGVYVYPDVETIKTIVTDGGDVKPLP